MRRAFLALLLVAVAVAVAVAAPGLAQLRLGGSADNLLEPEKVFRFSAQARDGAVEVRFAIADGYYMYRDKFRFAAEGNPQVRLGSPQLPPAIRHQDEFFGEVASAKAAARSRNRRPESCA